MFHTLRKILAGNLVSQLIGLCSLPLLGFFYTTAEIGQYGVFFAVSAIASVFVTLRIENIFFSVRLALVENLHLVAIAATAMNTIVLGIFLFLAAPWLSAPVLIGASLFCALAIGLFNISYSVAVRNERTGAHVAWRVVRALLELGIIIMAVLFKLKIAVLLWLIPLPYLLCAFFLAAPKLSNISLQFKSGRTVFESNVKAIKYDVLASVLNAGALYAPVLYFYFKHDASFSGMFFLITRYLGTPLLMVAQSIGTTLKQHASAESEIKGTCVDSVEYIKKNVIIRPWAFYSAGVVVVISVAKAIDVFLGLNVFLLTLALMPLFFIRYLFNCVSSIVYVIGLQKHNLIFQAALFCASVLGLFLPGTLIHSVFLYSALSMVVYIAFLRYLITYSVEKI